MPADPFGALGATLNAVEASGLADWLADGASLGKALQVLSAERRPVVRSLLHEAGLTGKDAVGVLRAIAGAHRQARTVEPVWTVPGAQVAYGRLTSTVKSLVLGARESVVCSTFNFQKSSALWTTLAEVANQQTVAVTVYLDTHATASGHAPSPAEVSAHLPGAGVFRTRRVAGHRYRNHAKFIALDQQVLIVTSANFSLSAEQFNLEFGLIVRDAPLAQSVVKQLFDLQPTLYERVKGNAQSG